MKTTRTELPGSDVAEVSIFGPGYGESVVVHMGNNEWVLVDSCMDKANGLVPSLEYLAGMGVNLAKDVRLIVGTHAHDDHIAGISRIVAACESAFFVCSSALTTKEFAALIEYDEERFSIVRSRTYGEYRAIQDALKARGRSPSGVSYLKKALEQRPLLDLDRGDSGPAAKVIALSPSDEADTRSKRALAVYALKNRMEREPRSIDPNELSVALWVEVGEKAILLGADLLRGPAGCGWQAVLATHRPKQRASVFKVPHHGAPNAHYLEVWQSLLSNEPIALLAPFRAGSRARPDGRDRARICRLTHEAFITAPPDGPPRTRSVRESSAALSGIARNVRDASGEIGHVRARSGIGEVSWKVERFAPARRLC